MWYGSEAEKRLRKLGDVVRNEEPGTLTFADLRRVAPDGVDVIVTDRLTPGESEMFREWTNLVAFVRCAMDIGNIDVDAASEAGVLVTRASPGWIDSVSELIVGQMINLARGIPALIQGMREGSALSPPLGMQLSGKTLGIIGYGNLGKRLAEFGHAFAMQVLVADPNVTGVPGYVKHTSMQTVLSNSDFVVCLVVYTTATENLIDSSALALMKQTAYFINASRGGTVDEDALARALRQNRIRGAALDVGRDEDNRPTWSLASLPNVLATPHVGGLVPEAIAHQAHETVDQVEAILNGLIPSGALNAPRATRLARLRPSPVTQGQSGSNANSPHLRRAT